MEKTPLHELHRECGAKFGAFAGFELPLFFRAGIMAEHLHARASAALFDVSHMVQVALEGKKAAQAISRLCPFDAEKAPLMGARYSFLLNEKAGAVDDVIVTRLAEERFLIVCNAACAEKDFEHIRARAEPFGIVPRRLSRALLALQGPLSESILADIGMDFSSLRFMQSASPEAEWLVSRAGYTGEDGFEIALPEAEAESLARELLRDERVLPAGLGARDSLRLEAGLALYGHELDEALGPVESGLSWAIPKSRRSGGDFVGAEALAEQFAQGVPRKRIGLKPEGRAPLRAGAEVFDATGERLGAVSSGGFSPSLGHPVAMAIVSSGANPPFRAELRGKRVSMEAHELPFVPHRYKRESGGSAPGGKSTAGESR